MKKLLVSALILLLAGIAFVGAEGIQEQADTYEARINQLTKMNKNLDAQLKAASEENVALEEKLAEVTPPQGTATKKSIAAKLAGEITLDGYADEWEQNVAFKADPMYSGDSFDVIPKSVLWMAWDAKNLYVFARVLDNKISVLKPKEFWAVDCLELFIDGMNTKGEGYDINSAQFWLCPASGDDPDNPIYIGQWKRPGDAIEATIYGNLPGMEGAVVVDDLGYSMEIKIPASNLAMEGFSHGQVIGFNYTVFDADTGAGTHWSASKAVKTFEHPNTWGDVELVY